MKQDRLLITGGGTGGHLSPGIAIYEEMKEREMRPMFLAGKADRKFSIMNAISPRDSAYYRAPSFTKNIFKLPFFCVLFFFAVLKALRVIRKNDVTHVLGMGGYVSAPALTAAKLKRLPIFLCEQNTVPGKVTSIFEKKAKRIYGAFAVSRDYLTNKDAFLYAGNPIRKHVLQQISRSEARRFFHLEHCDKVLLVIGGSQGALRLNKLIFELRKKYPSEFENVGVIWSAGAVFYKEFKDRVQTEQEKGSVYLSPYIDKVGAAYRASDLAISRSGAGVMMELAAAGLPSILIPYPYAAMGHQDKNADVFCEEGAAVKISDSDATADFVAPVLFGLLKNRSRLEKMAERNMAIAKKDAAAFIVDDILSQREKIKRPK